MKIWVSTPLHLSRSGFLLQQFSSLILKLLILFFKILISFFKIFDENVGVYTSAFI